MSLVAKVVEDGVDERAAPEARSKWLLASVGFGLGLVLGTLIALPGDLSAPAEDAFVDPDLFELPEAVAPPVAEDGGISMVVAGFPDGLVGLGHGQGSGFDHLLWPVRGPLITRAASGSADVSFDASGRFLALSEHVPGLDGVVLSFGRASGVRPLMSGVTSFAWHDSDSGRLAFTTEEAGEWALFTVSANLVPEPAVSGGFDGATLAAWGGWGYAIQTPDDQVVLLTRDGELKGHSEGIALGSHEDGWVLVDDHGLKLVSAGGGVRRLQTSEIPDGVVDVSFSPDGNLVAVAGGDGVVLLDLDTLEETKLAPSYTSLWVAWSSDSRFVIAPARSGVLIHDVVGGDTHNILVGHRIVAAAALPLSSS